MKTIKKIAITLAAALITLAGFNLIAASSLVILKTGEPAGARSVANYMVHVEAPRV
jgi:hypothetical protein